MDAPCCVLPQVRQCQWQEQLHLLQVQRLGHSSEATPDRPGHDAANTGPVYRLQWLWRLHQREGSLQEVQGEESL